MAMRESSKPQFKKNLLIYGKIRVLTGIHIGGNKAELKIGGTDNPVITDPEGRPYIPGSSLKGKMRCMLELSLGKVSEGGNVHNCNGEDCEVCTIFGSSNNESKGPTRLIVRDAKLEGDAFETELKTENMINRLSGKAEHPRTTERVPAGAVFSFEMVYSIYDDSDYSNFKRVISLLSMLEDSYLGGSGSRGYGKVAIEDMSICIKTLEDYQKGTQGRKISVCEKGVTPKELLEKYADFDKELKGGS